MSLVDTCPRCPGPLAGGECPRHGPQPPLRRPAEATYEAFAAHLQLAGDFPTLLPWPLGPAWRVSDVGAVVGPRGVVATVTCCSGATDLDGPVDVLVVAEEVGVGLGCRCAGLDRVDPGDGFDAGPPVARVRVGSQGVALWPVSTSGAAGELDRAVLVGEAGGRWLWVVLLPASAMLLMKDEWILRDVSTDGAHLVELSFGGPAPVW